MKTTIWFSNNTHVHRDTSDWEDAKALFALLAEVDHRRIFWDWFGSTLRAYDLDAAAPDCEPPYILLGIISLKEPPDDRHLGPVPPPLAPDPQDRRLPTAAPRPPARF